MYLYIIQNYRSNLIRLFDAEIPKQNENVQHKQQLSEPYVMMYVFNPYILHRRGGGGGGCGPALVSKIVSSQQILLILLPQPHFKSHF